MSTLTLEPPAISRIWRGRVPRARADEYEAYLYEEGIKPLIAKALGVQVFTILVGKGGEMIREIGKAARHRLMELTEQPVHLRLFVRVTERWRNVPRQLAELGYSPQSS